MVEESCTRSLYIDGYASSRGELIYNSRALTATSGLGQTGSDKQGIPEDRIVLAVDGAVVSGLSERSDECWAKNRLVRFSYSPN